MTNSNLLRFVAVLLVKEVFFSVLSHFIEYSTKAITARDEINISLESAISALSKEYGVYYHKNASFCVKIIVLVMSPELAA